MTVIKEKKVESDKGKGVVIRWGSDRVESVSLSKKVFIFALNQ